MSVRTDLPIKAVKFNGSSIPLAGGGGSGYNVTLIFNGGYDTDVYFALNGTVYQIDQYFDSHSSFIFPTMAGIETIAVTADHYSTSPYVPASSWFRFRNVGSSAWTNMNEHQVYTLTGDIELQFGFGSCLLKGTLITMADGSKKPIEDIEIGDMVKGYDGEPKRVYMCQHGQGLFRPDFDIWDLADGTRLYTTLRHEFYNADRQKMMYINDFDIGESLVREDGEEVKLVNHEYLEEACQHFSLWCEDNLYWADGFLCGNRHSKQIYTRGGRS